MSDNFVLFRNVTVTPLGANETYTTRWEDVSQWDGLIVALKSDQTGTLNVEFSVNASTVDSTLTFDVAAATNEVHRITVTRQYFRIRYVNDATPQTYFRVSAIGGSYNILSSAANAVIARDADAIFTRGMPSFLEIATNKFSGVTKNNKVGLNTDIDSATVPEWLWEGGGVYTGFPTGNAEAIRITSSDANDTAAGTGARTVVVTGLDANWAIASETIPLSGTTPAVSVGTFRRIHTAYVATSGNSNANFNAGTLTIQHNVTTANIFLTIAPGRNQSYAAVFTVPDGKVGCVINMKVEVDRSASGSIAGFMWVREFGAAPRYRRPFTASNTSVFFEDPYGGIVYPAKTDLGIVVTSCSANNTSVQGAFDIVLIDDD